MSKLRKRYKYREEQFETPGVGKPKPTPPRKRGRRLPSYFGWYDRPDQASPSHEPGFGVPCPHCMMPVGRHSDATPIKTVSLAAHDSPGRSYFYRVHKACRSRASAAEICSIDSIVIDSDKIN